MSFIDEPITLLGDLFEKLGDDEAIIAEFPNGYKRYICKRSKLDKFDAAWPIDRPYEYDWVDKTYHVKLTEFKPGSCDSQKVEPLTLGDLTKKLGPGEAIKVELPYGKTRLLNCYSRLDRIDAALWIDKCYKYDPATKTYYVKVSTLETYLSPKKTTETCKIVPPTLGDICKDLGRDEKMIVEFPNGLTKTYYFHSDFRHLDDEQFLVKSCEYDCPSKTYHVKVEKKYKPGFIDASKVKEHIKMSLNSYYGIDPISHMKDIKEWYGLLYGKNLKIKRIICDGPATIIFWADGTKTIVKAQEEFDYEKGILYAALKKLATKKEYDNILRAIDKVHSKDDPVKAEEITEPEYHQMRYPVCGCVCPEPTNQCGNDHVESEKPKKKVYKRHFGDSNQRCPYCGQNWVWTQNRRTALYHDGFIKFTCKNCGRKIIYTKEGKYA